MKFLFLFLLSCTGMISIAQDSWKICLDEKILLNTSTEDAEKNTIQLSAASLKNAKSFTVDFTEANPQKGWQRSILVYDEKDNELKKQAGKKLMLKISELQSLLEKYKTIKIYTINMPTDPKMKAQVRIRRVHLCTLVLE